MCTWLGGTASCCSSKSLSTQKGRSLCCLLSIAVVCAQVAAAEAQGGQLDEDAPEVQQARAAEQQAAENLLRHVQAERARANPAGNGQGNGHLPVVPPFGPAGDDAEPQL